MPAENSIAIAEEYNKRFMAYVNAYQAYQAARSKKNEYEQAQKAFFDCLREGDSKKALKAAVLAKIEAGEKILSLQDVVNELKTPPSETRLNAIIGATIGFELFLVIVFIVLAAILSGIGAIIMAGLALLVLGGAAMWNTAEYSEDHLAEATQAERWVSDKMDEQLSQPPVSVVNETTEPNAGVDPPLSPGIAPSPVGKKVTEQDRNFPPGPANQ